MRAFLRRAARYCALKFPPLRRFVERNRETVARLQRERDGMARERDELAQERDELLQERDGLWMRASKD